MSRAWFDRRFSFAHLTEEDFPFGAEHDHHLRRMTELVGRRGVPAAGRDGRVL